MIVRPGYGLPDVWVGEHSSALLASFREPSRRGQCGKLREYWHYPEADLEVAISRNTGQILGIFFGKRWALEGPAQLDLFAATPEAIRKRFSAPNSEGGGIRLGDGTYINRWFSYSAGIGFDFDQSDHVVRVSVFRRQRKAKGKSAARHIPNAKHDIAAFQRG